MLPKEIILKIIQELDIIKHCDAMIERYGCNCRAINMSGMDHEEEIAWAYCVRCEYSICKKCTAISLHSAGNFIGCVAMCDNCARRCPSCSSNHFAVPEEGSRYASLLSECWIHDDVSEEDARCTELELNPEEWDQCSLCQRTSCCCYKDATDEFVCASCIRNRHFTVSAA